MEYHLFKTLAKDSKKCYIKPYSNLWLVKHEFCLTLCISLITLCIWYDWLNFDWLCFIESATSFNCWIRAHVNANALHFVFFALPFLCLSLHIDSLLFIACQPKLVPLVPLWNGRKNWKIVFRQKMLRHSSLLCPAECHNSTISHTTTPCKRAASALDKCEPKGGKPKSPTWNVDMKE